MKNDQLSNVSILNGSKVNSIPLDEDTQKELRSLDQSIKQKKFSIGEIDYQLAVLEMQKTDLVQKLHAETKTLNDLVNTTAKSLGLDPNDPSKGRWGLDLTAQEIAFNRVG